MSRSTAGVALACAVLSGSCSEATAPPSYAGYYQLVSISGMPLPVPIGCCSVGNATSIAAGDLLLRPNGTFLNGLRSGFGPVHGTYNVSGGGVVLTADFNVAGGTPYTMTARWSADEVTVRYPMAPGVPNDFLFRRVALPSVPMASGTYVIASINGAGPPFEVQLDPLIGTGKWIFRVPFDSITFHDGAFFRRHRREETGRLGSPDFSYYEWEGGGSYVGGSNRVILQHYYPAATTPQLDTLFVESGKLVRRTDFGTTLVVEAFHRP